MHLICCNAFIIPDKVCWYLSDSWEADIDNGSFADRASSLSGRCFNSSFPYIMFFGKH